jgi:hypothetical protein
MIAGSFMLLLVGIGIFVLMGILILPTATNELPLR